MRACLFAFCALAICAGSAASAQTGARPLERTFPDGASLRLYGLINWGVLRYDDGRDVEVYAPVDNANETSRLGLVYARALGSWRFRNLNEIQYAPYSTENVNILRRSPSDGDWAWSNANIRKIDFSLEHPRRGRISLGQGEMATYSAPEADLSGTDVIAYSEIEDTAQGQLFRYAGRGLGFRDSISDISVGDAFNNYDGPRVVRLRYDTPEFRGFALSASWGRNLLTGEGSARDDDLADAALRYDGKVGPLTLSAAAGYFWDEGGGDVLSGSVSGLHARSGLSLTAAAGRQEGAGAYGYAKLGLTRSLVRWGPSSFSIDYYRGDDIAAEGSRSVTYSLSAVQDVGDTGLQLWLTARRYAYDDDAAEYLDGTAVFGGAIFQF